MSEHEVTVDCRTARDQILNASIDADVQAHLEECDACAQLAAENSRLARALGPAGGERPVEGFDDLMATVEAEDASVRGRLRALPTWQRLALLFVAAVSFGAIIFAVWRRPDWSVYPMARMVLIALSMLAATAVGVLLALPRYFRPATSALLRGLGIVFLLVVAFLPAILPEAHSLHPASAGADNFWVGLAKCAGLGTVAAVPVIALAWALKRNDGLEWWSTLAVALVGGVGANLALQMHCPIVDPMHILLSHSALAFVYAAAAWVLVRVSR